MSSDPGAWPDGHDDLAIDVRDVGKSYHIYERPSHRLLQGLVRGSRQYYREFWALRGVNLQVRPGQTVGVVGRNGSGKSTLLQVVCGTLQASAGSVEVRGRVAALLELGAGFNVEFTGRENVYLNGSILGLSRERIAERMPEILAFAEIGEHIDQPVKTYSSGMFVRLAFAVAAHCDPEILVVDEALAVGDVYFQRKCYRRIEQLRDGGCTLLLVTHSTGTLVQLCDRGILLEDGRVLFDGECAQAVREYMKCLFGTHQPGALEAAARADAEALIGTAPDLADGRDASPVDAFRAGGAQDVFHTRAGYNRAETRVGDGRALLVDVMVTSGGEAGPVLRCREPFTVHVRYAFREAVDRLVFGMQLRTVDGLQVYSSNTMMAGQGLFEKGKGDVVTASFDMQCTLLPGQYFLGLGVSRVEEGGDEIVALDRRVDSVILTVIGDHARAAGHVDLACEIDVDARAGASDA